MNQADNGEATVDDLLDLADYRRRVAALYLDLRRAGVDRRSWERWSTDRSELLATHGQSPLDPARRASAQPVPYFDYDPSWQLVGTVEPLPRPERRGERPPPVPLAEGPSTFSPVAMVRFARAGVEYHLDLYRLDEYGGGLFLPFGDETNGVTTHEVGRYLLDGAKSADLGSPTPGRLLLDFNFAYHPSCVWDPQWACPLAPPGNRLPAEVAAGEQRPS